MRNTPAPESVTVHDIFAGRGTGAGAGAGGGTTVAVSGFVAGGAAVVSACDLSAGRQPLDASAIAIAHSARVMVSPR